jgi:hypothetical protein
MSPEGVQEAELTSVQVAWKRGREMVARASGWPEQGVTSPTTTFYIRQEFTSAAGHQLINSNLINQPIYSKASTLMLNW